MAETRTVPAEGSLERTIAEHAVMSGWAITARDCRELAAWIRASQDVVAFMPEALDEHGKWERCGTRPFLTRSGAEEFCSGFPGLTIRIVPLVRGHVDG